MGFQEPRPLESDRAIIPRPDRLELLLGASSDAASSRWNQVALSLAGWRAIDGSRPRDPSGQVHGLIAPRSGKTTTLDVISGYSPSSPARSG